MDVSYLKAIYSWSVDELKKFLKERRIPVGSLRKSELQRQVHLAIQFKYSVSTPERSIEETVFDKLILENGTSHLPNPQTLDIWELQSPDIPQIDQTSIENYFAFVSENLGISSRDVKALSLGKGLVLSGHVGAVLYCKVNTAIDYGFLKTYVTRQTNVKEPPHSVWAMI